MIETKVLRLDWWYWNVFDSQQQYCQPGTRCLHYLWTLNVTTFPSSDNSQETEPFLWRGEYLYTCIPSSLSPSHTSPSIYHPGFCVKFSSWEENRCTWSCFKFHYKSQIRSLDRDVKCVLNQRDSLQCKVIRKSTDFFFLNFVFHASLRSQLSEGD